MTLEACHEHLERLYSGNRKLAHLTPERLRAIFDRYRHHDEIVLKTAVDEMLCDASMPSTARFDGAMNAAAEAIRMRQAAADRADAVRFMDGRAPLQDPGLFDENEHLWASLHYALFQGIMAGRIAPESVPAWNGKIQQAFDAGWGGELLDELVRLGAELPVAAVQFGRLVAAAEVAE